MKKKFRLWLNIATICLCLCAIAVGVYSASNASLKVSGSIGFSAHGVKVSITGTLSGYVSKDNINAPVNGETEIKNLPTTGSIDLNNDSKAIDLGEVYFTDLVLDENGKVPKIELNLTFTNTSKFKVRATVNALTATGITITYDKTTLILDEDDGEGTLKVTFSLVDQKNSLATAVNMATVTATTPLVSFAKLTGYEQGEYYIDNNMLYVKYGTYPTTERNDGFNSADMDNSLSMYGSNLDQPMRWYAFAELDSSGSVIKTLSGVTDRSSTVASDGVLTFTQGESLKNRTFYFVAEYAHDAMYFQDSSTKGQNLNDYEYSDARTYLISTETTGFAKTYGLGDTLTITSREMTATTTDKFWLLSRNEAFYLTQETQRAVTYPAQGVKPYWWLRSPNEYVDECAFFVRSDGSEWAIENKVNENKFALRAAFQITIN